MPNYAKNHTKSEKKMWWLYLLGYYMPRKSIHGWNLDWYSPLWGVSIEVNGSWHDQAQVRLKDSLKRSRLAQKGIYTLEITNKRGERSGLYLGLEVISIGILWRCWRIVRFTAIWFARLLREAFTIQ